MSIDLRIGDEVIWEDSKGIVLEDLGEYVIILTDEEECEEIEVKKTKLKLNY